MPAKTKASLSQDSGGFTYIVDANFTFVSIYNASLTPVVLSKRARLEDVIENYYKGCYIAAPELTPLAASTTWSTLSHAIKKSAKKVAIGATAVLAAAAVI